MAVISNPKILYFIIYLIKSIDICGFLEKVGRLQSHHWSKLTLC